MDKFLIKTKLGMSLIEILIALVIFSLAMVPLLSFTFTTTRGTYSVGKHMMAGQLAASLMDRFLGMPYRESINEAKKAAAEGWKDALADSLLVAILENASSAAQKKEIEQDLKKSFRFFKTKITVKEATGEDADKMFLLTVEVSWRVDDGSESSRQSIELKALKYREYI